MTATILVTRPSEQPDTLVEALRACGLGAIKVPTVEIDASPSRAALDAMLGSLSSAEWLVLTSANGARAVAARLAANRLRLPVGLRVAAVGPATADALHHAGIRVDHVPDAYLTVAIADGLGDVEARRVVLARADSATPGLRRALLARGAIVDEVVAYRILEGPPGVAARLSAALLQVAGIAFTSGSTVRGMLRIAADRDRALQLPAFCIGPVTAREARRAGFTVAAVADVHTAQGLAAAIHDHVSREDR